MAGGSTRGLYLQISAETSALKAGLTAGKSALVQFSGDITKQLDAVDASFASFGIDGAQKSLRQIQSDFRRTFGQIQQDAQKAVALPRSSSGAIDIDAAGARRAADSATAQAAALREIAAAAARAAQAEQGENVQLNLRAVAARSAALATEEGANALRDQAAAAEAVQSELDRAGKSSVVLADTTVGAHNRISASSLILQHVLRSTGDSFAAGLPPAQIFAEQVGRVGEAVSFLAAEKGGGGSLGAVAAFLTGPWGAAFTLGLSVLGPFVAKLFEAHDALELAKVGDDGLAEAQGALGKMFDLTSGKLEHQNQMLRLNAQLTAINLRAQAAQERTSAQQTTDSAQHGDITKRVLDTVMSGVTDSRNPFVGARNTRDANVSRIGGILQGVQNGSISKEDALASSEHLDFTGSKITVQQFQQAIIDAATAPLKDQIAGEIDKSLATGTLDPALRRDPPTRRGRQTQDHSAQQALTSDINFTQEERKLQAAYLDAAQRTTANQDARDALAKEEIEAERAATAKTLTDRAAKGAFGKAGSDESNAELNRLLGLNDAVSKQKAQNIDLDRQSANVALQFQIQEQQLDAQITLLKLQEDLATNAADRKKLADQIFDLEQKRATLDPRKVLADPKSSQDQQDAATKQLADQAAAAPLQKQLENKQNEGPLAAYRDQLTKATGDMNTALQNVEVDGLGKLEDGLVGVISGTKSVSDAFKEMASSTIADKSRIRI